MVKDYIKEHLIQIISLVPVVFIATGTFILNIYLYQYGIMDILLFDSRTIFTGFMAFFIFVVYIFLCPYIVKIPKIFLN